MGLTFLNPLFLFGLAAGILPILIHRLTPMRAARRKFSAVRLLLRSQRDMARPQRLRHLLLLILRILVIAGVVLLTARPVLTWKALPALAGKGVRAIILDNSMSMAYREEEGDRLDLARKAAREVIEHTPGEFFILPTVFPPGGAPEIRWLGPEEALRELAALPPSFARGNPSAALGLALERLKGDPRSGEVLFIGDLARGDWEGLNPGGVGTLPAGTEITFLRLGGPSRDANWAVKGVELPAGQAVAGVPCRLEVTVANLSDRPASNLVRLFLDRAKVDQKSLELKAGEEGKVSFELSLDQARWMEGEVTISGDRLAPDDTFYFPLPVREKVKVLIVDGDPRRSLRQSESYYLVNALLPGGGPESPFLPRVITEGELAEVDLTSYEALFLLNAVRLPAARLAPFLEAGRFVFIFLGDRVLPEEYNRFPLLPWRVGERKEIEERRPGRITRVDDRRPALKPFREGGPGDSLRSASFRRYFKIEGPAKALLGLDNGDPLLVEAEAGKGRIFLFASSADLEWNDLPLKAAYLPSIQGLLKEGVGLAEKSPSWQPIDSMGTSRRGAPASGKEGRPIQLTGPRGGPGIYRFPLPSGEMRRGLNPPFRESDLGKMTARELSEKLGLEVMVMEYTPGAWSVRTGRQELWPFLLAFVLAALAAEMVLANRI